MTAQDAAQRDERAANMSRSATDIRGVRYARRVLSALLCASAKMTLMTMPRQNILNTFVAHVCYFMPRVFNGASSFADDIITITAEYYQRPPRRHYATRAIAAKRIRYDMRHYTVIVYAENAPLMRHTIIYTPLLLPRRHHPSLLRDTSPRHTPQHHRHDGATPIFTPCRDIRRKHATSATTYVYAQYAASMFTHICLRHVAVICRRASSRNTPFTKTTAVCLMNNYADTIRSRRTRSTRH